MSLLTPILCEVHIRHIEHGDCIIYKLADNTKSHVSQARDSNFKVIGQRMRTLDVVEILHCISNDVINEALEPLRIERDMLNLIDWM